MATLIRRELDAAVAIVTLDKPPHNLIDGEFLDQYCVALETSVADGARAILVRSELRHFCAGADVTTLSPDVIDAPIVLERIEAIPVPTVAAVHGAALGGGFELALTCDLIIAAESAKIGSVEVGIGLAPLLGSSHGRPRTTAPTAGAHAPNPRPPARGNRKLRAIPSAP